jgi:uncharacterized protein (DUF302 family)
MDYGITVRTHIPFAEAVARVRQALKAQGFGVLTEIDVQATLRDKLGQDMEDYLILGACNPPLAHRALDADRKIGLLLPCNVVVRTAGAQTIIEALNPQVMAEVAGQPALKPVADEATSKIRATPTGQHAERGLTDPRSIRQARLRPHLRPSRRRSAGWNRRSRRLLVTTNAELKAIAAAAISGLRNPAPPAGSPIRARRSPGTAPAQRVPWSQASQVTSSSTYIPAA